MDALPRRVPPVERPQTRGSHGAEIDQLADALTFARLQLLFGVSGVNRIV
ncbi:MAG: hypothetical protein M3O91_05310 [Chloroflexota bacterium]|nr:hypothetical protein [Chloroflexota bacterium]